MGSRGDAQPYVALARSFRDHGHEVRLAAHGRFAPLAAEHGLSFTPLAYEPLKAFERLFSPSGEGGVVDRWQRVLETLHGALVEWRQVAQGAEVLVTHPQIMSAPALAQHMGVPLVQAHTLPVVCPTSAYPCCYLFSKDLGRVLNRFSYRLIPAALTPLRQEVERWSRRELGLSVPWRASGAEAGPGGVPVQHLHGHSPTVLPRPPEWPSHWQATGYWTVPPGAAWAPDPELVRFLDAGDPPVYVGFGSMVYRGDRPRLTRALVEPFRRRGVRVVLVRGWALSPEGLENDDGIHFIDAYEGPWHDWLLPRTRAAVHHGGAGTVGAVLRAGRPQGCIPFAMDQPFWARRVEALGVGPPLLAMRRFTAARWDTRVEALLETDGYQERADGVAAALSREDGPGTAVRMVEEMMARRG